MPVKADWANGDTVSASDLNASAAQVNTNTTDIAAKYTKPGAGIPATDLATDAVTNAKMANNAVGIAELSASGTASDTTYLRGDNTWATPAGGGGAPLDATLNAQTGTSYTLVAGDDGKVVTLSNASAITLTVPQNSAAAIPVGAYIEFIQLGAGQVSFVAGSGATLRSRGTALKINGQYGMAALRKIATNEFVLAGDVTT